MRTSPIARIASTFLAQQLPSRVCLQTSSRMGNDGGSIPTRRELVKEAARNPTASELKESLTEQQDYFWNTDPLTQRPLSRPVVSDSLGRLFNKDSVIEFLLPAEDGLANKRSEQEEFIQGSIKSIKDVVQIIFEVENDSPGANGTVKPARNAITRPERWICPVTRQELGPGVKAVYLVPCGHAFSGAAIKEISENLCPQCNEPYASNDLIPILPTSETDIARLTLRVKSLKENGLTHSLKKASGGGKKKRKNGAVAEDSDAPTHQTLEQDDGAISKPVTKQSAPQPTSVGGQASNGIKNASTASLTAKILEEQEQRNKRRKIDKNENLDSLFSHSNAAAEYKKAKDNDFMNRGFSIPNRR